MSSGHFTFVASRRRTLLEEPYVTKGDTTQLHHLFFEILDLFWIASSGRTTAYSQCHLEQFGDGAWRRAAAVHGLPSVIPHG